MNPRARTNLLVAVLAIAVLAGAAWAVKNKLNIGETHTFSWTEDVALRDGNLLQVKRTQTNYSQPWSPPGNGGIKEQTISFKLEGSLIEWKWDEPWQMTSRYVPDILDIVDGSPVVVKPVDRSGPCEQFGYPPEGIVAFSFRAGRWFRIPVVNLPTDLKVNLLRDMNAVGGLNQVTVGTKVKGQDRTARIKQGMLLPELIWQYSNEEYACALIKPTPNPLFDMARDSIHAAEAAATVAKVEVIASASAPQKLSEQDFAQNIGTHTDGGYVRASCDGIVASLLPYYVWNQSSGGGSSVGYRIVLTNGTKGLSSVPVVGSALAGSQSVACDTDTIYGVKRPDRRSLIIHRFAHDGRLIEANRIDLTPIDVSLLDNPKSVVWSVSPSDDSSIALTLATIEPGWILGQHVTFRTTFPAKKTELSSPSVH